MAATPERFANLQQEFSTLKIPQLRTEATRLSAASEQAMTEIMDELSQKPYAVSMEAGKARAVFLLAPIRRSEQGVSFEDQNFLCTTKEVADAFKKQPAVVDYDLWVYATKGGFKALAQRASVNGVAIGTRSDFGKHVVMLASDKSGVRQQYGRDSDRGIFLGAYGIHRWEGNVDRFLHAIEEGGAIKLHGTERAKLDVNDPDTVSEAIEKSKSEHHNLMGTSIDAQKTLWIASAIKQRSNWKT